LFNGIESTGVARIGIMYKVFQEMIM